MILCESEGEEGQGGTPKTPSLAVLRLIGGEKGSTQSTPFPVSCSVRMKRQPCTLVKWSSESHLPRPRLSRTQGLGGQRFCEISRPPPRCLSHHAPDAQPLSPWLVFIQQLFIEHLLWARHCLGQ